ncbi:GYD domain-containing protein [Mesorhizobium sp. VK24D]|uniref:GYD domain-containing protein n=1 Tax=Mesorhizobium album TaxID=3072314 RepID=A0ABU4Y582_9HYPH|nr:GYD domain-containing protein [Mesorhizobium sp. VK24D]MDX8482097.1 GYD domain-containing protein [Mesorhizobium sp. VK24D]
MAHYVLLADFTDQGAKAAKDTVKRSEAFRQMAEKSGVKVQALFWTLGQYDMVAVAEAPDDNTATALSLSLASLGNVRTQTLRAFDAEEMKKIIAKMV